MDQALAVSLIASAMVLVAIKSRHLFTIAITTLLAIGTLVVWTDNLDVITIGFHLFTLGAFLSIVYGGIVHGLSGGYRFVICLSGLAMVVYQLAILFHWPFEGDLPFALVIPILAYLWLLLFKGLLFRRELAFLTIITTHFLLSLVPIIRYWF